MGPKRGWLSLAAGVCLAASVMPAHATTASGTVTAPAVSAGPQKTLSNAGGPNGILGFVITLPGTDGSYALTRTAGIGHLDAYFFRAGPAGTIGDSCSALSSDDSPITDPDFAIDSVQDGTETGTICPGTEVAKYAIIVLRSGAKVSFTFTS